MTIRHHLDDATVMRFASGDFDSAFNVVIAAHVDMCDTCRARIALAEEAGGAMLAQAEASLMQADSFNHLMSRIDGDRGEDIALPQRRAASDTDSDVPRPLRRFVGHRLDDIRWRWVAPGIRKHAIRLPEDPSSSLYLLHIAGNMAVPEHGHGGTELTLVLSGAYRDSMGRFAPGDIADLDEHLEHQPVVDGDDPCICLVATEQPTRFKGLISRVLQPIVGI